MSKHKIAVIAGDGIGKEVVPEGIRVLEAAGRKFDIQFQFDEKPWSCDYYALHGKMMPDDGLQRSAITMRSISARWASRRCRITFRCGVC